MEQFSEAKIADSEVFELASRVQFVVDPERFPNQVEIVLKNGLGMKHGLIFRRTPWSVPCLSERWRGNSGRPHRSDPIQLDVMPLFNRPRSIQGRDRGDRHSLPIAISVFLILRDLCSIVKKTYFTSTQKPDEPFSRSLLSSSQSTAADRPRPPYCTGRTSPWMNDR